MRFPKYWLKSRKKSLIWGLGLLTCVLLASLPAIAQTSGLPTLNLRQITPTQQPSSASQSGSTIEAGSRAIATGKVSLDGRTLFAIAAPAPEQTAQQSQTTPIKERVHSIEGTLDRIANSNFDPQTLRVTSEIDPNSRLPVISINDQYLMTVTTLDAQLQGQEPARWADQLVRLIEQALIQAHQERQPESLAHQGLVASGLLLILLIVSWAIAVWQRRLRIQKQQLQAEALPNSQISAEPAAENTTAIAVDSQERQRHRKNLIDLKSRVSRIAQIGLWSLGVFTLLGLFPYTRWLQPFLFSTPLKILGIFLGIYVLVRVSDLAIEQFTGALSEGTLIEPAVSQRVSLRVSTFSRVLKSVARVIWFVVGLLAALSVIGVDLVPLLAGAGIIGLAISFAAQSLIKDMINGILILFEDQYAVGDVIVVGEVSGFVENMNLRITQLRDSEGKLITIPNGTITVVQNLSKDWSRVDLKIDLAYGTDPDHALKIIRQLAQDLYNDPEWRSQMPEAPEVLGIDEMDHTGLLIRVWIKTLPLKQWVVAREFRRRLAHVLDKEGLAIGVPQQSLWFKSSLDLDMDQTDQPDKTEVQRIQ